jgi:valyl-tRNA synthetase
MEARWRAFWEDSGVYRYDPTRGRAETFVVDTPPPTVSGSLHVGHVFSYTHTDLMVRYRRMGGANIYYPMGWDDNGVPTERRVQNVFSVRCEPSLPYDPNLQVEWQREGEVISVSRRNFIELCDQVVQEDEKQFKGLWHRLGLSVDWNETYATIDERSRRVSQESFLNLLEQGEAELREAPTMWDVDFRTAVAQAEVEDRPRQGAFHRITFGVDGGGDFTIATTRPELLPACIAVVGHPNDARYKHLYGKKAITPLFRAPVPIFSSEEADPEKGTGIMMICTFGDSSDIERWRELGVPAREVIGREGRIVPVDWGNDHWISLDPPTAQEAYGELVGLPVNRARRRIIELLGDIGAVDGEPEMKEQFVKFYEKGERPLEFVVSRQWFIKVIDKKDRLIEQGRRINWHPEFFRKRYEDWVLGLNQDWNVSRQRYFGVPIPVWYEVSADGSVDYDALILPKRENLPVDPSADAPPGYTPEQRGRPGGFVGDPDVFDTWATSSLTPLLTTGWPEDKRRFADLFPSDLRPQAHDIIRTWAFYTIARSLLEVDSIPWRDIAISGWILDPDRKKMSKSRGNVVLPTDMLDEYGSDAVRYWSASARLGVDTAYDPKVFREGKRLVTKIRNAARLIKGYEGASGVLDKPLDRALVARLRALVEEVTKRWEDWDHAGALAATETWFWSDLCDNYLELSKARAYDGDGSAITALRAALDVVLRLFAPVVPYVTEEVFNSERDAPESIHRAPWPRLEELPEGEDDGCFGAAVELLTQIRRVKSEAKVSLRFPVERLAVSGPRASIDLLESVIDDVKSTVNVKLHELILDDSLDALSVDVVLGEPEEAGAR